MLLRTKAILFFSALIIFFTGIIIFFLDYSVRDEWKHQIVDSLQVVSSGNGSLYYALKEGSTALDEGASRARTRDIAWKIVGNQEAFIQSFETAETRIVDNDRFVIASTDLATGEGVRDLSDPVMRCFDDTENIAEEYLNYRGTSVVGVSVCIADEGLVIVSEIEMSEAYAFLDRLRQKIILSGIAVTIVLLLALLLASQRTFERLLSIFRVVERVSRGEMSARVPIGGGKDEIGQLARVFNTILDTIVASQDKIRRNEKEILEKTRTLEEDIRNHKGQETLLTDSKRATLNLLEDMIQTKEHLEIEEYRLKTILSSIGDGLILIDGAYLIKLVNPRALEMLAIPAEDILGKDLRTVMKLLKKRNEEVPPEHWPTEEMFLTNKVVMVGLEAEFFLATNRRTAELPVALSVAPLGGAFAGGVIVIRDVTADRELDDAKSGFISVASHQLRTPLTTIRWYSEMLLSEDAGALSDTQKDFLNEIHGGAERLYQTIDLLLGISRVESGRIKEEKTPIDLTAFTNDIVHELAPSVTEKGLTVSVMPPSVEIPNVFLDQLMLRQVVMNLVSNAIRYTNKNGTIEIFWSKSGDNREAVYSVSDNGIGIPESQRGRIFTKFFRAENALVKVPDGSGLGLALVKELVETWKGRVWFETEEGKGTTFTFTVPLVTDVA